MLYQQGDVLFFKVENFSNIKKEKIESKNNKLIVAEGEATGHNHAIDSDNGFLYKDLESECLLLELLKKSEVKHQEHHSIFLPKGKYKINIVKEYDHFFEESRRVYD